MVSRRKGDGLRVLAMAAAAIFIIVVAAIYLPGRPTGSVLPGYEGVHFILVGVQPSGSTDVYTANSNATSLCLANAAECPFVQDAPSSGAFASGSEGSYSWEYDQTHSTVTMTPACGLCAFGTPTPVSVDVKPATQAPAAVSSVSYIDKSAGYQVVGTVYSTTAQLTLFGSGDINYQFRDDTLWFAVYDEAWNNVNEGSPQNGAAWSTPLLVEYLGAPTPPPEDSTPAQNYQTNPGTTSGIEPLTLYSVPQTSSSFGGLLGSAAGASGLNSTLASENVLYPDTQMLEYGFFPVVLTDFGSYGCGGFFGVDQGECDNTLQLSLQIYTLQLGTSTWTNPITQTQTTQTNNCQGAGCSNPFAGLEKLFSNPLTDSLIFLAAVVLIIVLFAPEVLAALGAAAVGMARRRGSG